MTMTHNLFPQSLKTVGTLLLLSAGLPSMYVSATKLCLCQQQSYVCVSNSAMSVSATNYLCQQQSYVCVINKAMYVSATELCLCQQQSYVCISNKTMWQQQTSVCVSYKALSVSATNLCLCQQQPDRRENKQ